LNERLPSPSSFDNAPRNRATSSAQSMPFTRYSIVLWMRTSRCDYYQFRMHDAAKEVSSTGRTDPQIRGRPLVAQRQLMPGKHPEYAFHGIENKQAHKKAFEANRLKIDGDMLIFNRNGTATVFRSRDRPFRSRDREGAVASTFSLIAFIEQMPHPVPTPLCMIVRGVVFRHV